VLRKLGSTGTLLNPLALNTQLTTLSKSVATDSGFDMDKIGALATSLAGLGQGDLRFLTVPTKGTGWSPDHTQSIVLLDDAKSSPLWQSVRKDAMPDWLRANHPELLPPVVR
jgi:hypothetical protein